MSQDTPALATFKIWAAMAWADGTLDDAEADTLRRLIDAAGLSPAERERASSWLHTPIGLDSVSVAGMPENTRRGIYRVAIKLSAVDLDISAPELALLERLRGILGISVEDAEALMEDTMV